MCVILQTILICEYSMSRGENERAMWPLYVKYYTDGKNEPSISWSKGSSPTGYFPKGHLMGALYYRGLKFSSRRNLEKCFASPDRSKPFETLVRSWQRNFLNFYHVCFMALYFAAALRLNIPVARNKKAPNRYLLGLISFWKGRTRFLIASKTAGVCR